jgi:hypothetical protein
VAIYNENQRKKMIERASKTSKSRGRATDDKRSFLLANLAASADSPEQETSHRPSKRARIRSMGTDKPSEESHVLARPAKKRRKYNGFPELKQKNSQDSNETKSANTGQYSTADITTGKLLKQSVDPTMIHLIYLQ